MVMGQSRDDVAVEYLDLQSRTALSNLGVGVIRSWLDEYGDPVDETRAAVAIVQWDSGGWSPVLISAFQTDLKH